MRLPDGVLGMAARGADWAGWVERLPALLEGLLEEWELSPDGPVTHGFASVVVPVLDGDRPAILKAGFPDEESEHEHLALGRWGGNGAVRLLRADPHRRALLLERLRDVSLLDTWDLEACEVVAGLYRRLHVPATPALRPLSAYVAPSLADLRALPRDAPLPRRLVEQAVSVGGDLVRDPATDGTLIHADLHYANVLAADRAEWLAIDPKPLSGDPHYEVAPMLWNRVEELAGPGLSVRDGLRRRFHTIVDAAGLDENRARDWVIVRMLVNALWQLRETGAADQWITTCVTVAKAVQD